MLRYTKFGFFKKNFKKIPHFDGFYYSLYIEWFYNHSNKEVNYLGLLRIPENELSDYIRKISSGDEDALEQFYKDHAQYIFSVIFSIVHTKESAEEVLQDVLMSIVNYGFKKPVRNARAWLFRVIINASLKKAEEDKKYDSESLSVLEDTVSNESLSNITEDSIDQIESLRSLNPTERKCVLMVIIGGLKLTQAAKILGLTYRRTRDIYYYAVRKLRQYYEKGGHI